MSSILAVSLLTTHTMGVTMEAAPGEEFVFTSENFRKPKLPHGLDVVDVPAVVATEESLDGYGYLISSADERTTDKKNFEIVPWPVSGWRKLDPETGDEAGTTEGDFRVFWKSDYFYGENLAIATSNNKYLDGLGEVPENANIEGEMNGDGEHIYLWMSDYHPDGGQLFWPREPIPFTVCLGKRDHGDDIKPENMRAFHVPAGKGVYIHPSTWHNGVYCRPEFTKDGPATFLTRQGRVHGRVSASWANEFKSILKVPLRAQ